MKNRIDLEYYRAHIYEISDVTFKDCIDSFDMAEIFDAPFGETSNPYILESRIDRFINRDKISCERIKSLRLNQTWFNFTRTLNDEAFDKNDMKRIRLTVIVPNELNDVDTTITMNNYHEWPIHNYVIRTFYQGYGEHRIHSFDGEPACSSSSYYPTSPNGLYYDWREKGVFHNLEHCSSIYYQDGKMLKKYYHFFGNMITEEQFREYHNNRDYYDNEIPQVWIADVLRSNA